MQQSPWKANTLERTVPHASWYILMDSTSNVNALSSNEYLKIIFSFPALLVLFLGLFIIICLLESTVCMQFTVSKSVGS